MGGCCRWNVLLGCRANDADAQCYSGNPCDTTVAPGPSPPGPGKKVVGGLMGGGVIAGAIGAAVMGKSTTTMPGTTGGGVTTQGVGTTAATTTTDNSGDSSSSLLWLWILLGILALCCLLALCGGGLAACMGGKKKKKKTKRATRVSEPAPFARRRGAAGVVAYGASSVGAVRDDADGRTDDGGDGSDGTYRNTHNGRNCRPDDADSCTCSVFDDASDADGRTRSFSDAGDGERNGCASLPCDINAWDGRVRNPSVLVDPVMMRIRRSFATRSAIDGSRTRGVFSDGIKACGQSLPACFQARGQSSLHGTYAGKVSQR